MRRLLFVCSGNICRSPTAEGVMRRLVHDAGLDAEIELDSAGIGGWHVGDAPDPRSAAAAARRGFDIDGAARQVAAPDFDRFDLLLAADRTHERDLRRLAPDADAATKVRLLREWDPEPGDLEVPDPYYGGERGFEAVLDIVERSCRGLLDALGHRPGASHAQ